MHQILPREKMKRKKVQVQQQQKFQNKMKRKTPKHRLPNQKY